MVESMMSQIEKQRKEGLLWPSVEKAVDLCLGYPPPDRCFPSRRAATWRVFTAQWRATAQTSYFEDNP